MLLKSLALSAAALMGQNLPSKSVPVVTNPSPSGAPVVLRQGSNGVYYYVQGSGAKGEVVEAPAAGGVTPSQTAAGMGEGGDRETADAAEEATKWPLERALEGTTIGQFMANNRLKLYGWVDQSYTASNNTHNQPLNPTNGTVVWNDRANRYLMQQAYARFERELDTESDEFSWGFRVDFLGGTDYRYTLPRGLWNSQLMNAEGRQNLYGIDLPQFYLSGNMPCFNTSAKLGRWFTPFGVESIEAPTSPFMSKSFAFNWSPPFTHTGVLFTTAVNDQLSISYGLAGGNDVFIDPAMQLNTVGVINYTTSDKKSTVNLGWALGNGRFLKNEAFAPTTFGLMAEGAGRNNFNCLDLVLTRQLSDSLSVTFEALYGWQTGAVNGFNYSNGIDNPVYAGDGLANWFAMPLYFFYKVNDKLTLQTRSEGFWDMKGQRTGVETFYFAQTFGAYIKFTDSIILRPEIRWDHSNDVNPLYGNGHELITGGADLILRW